MRVALYTRVSTDMQANKDEGSLDTQEARLRSSLAGRAGAAEVVRVFREEGESGKNLDRPELQALLAGIRAGDFDLLMVTRIDRLSRSLLDFYQVHELMKKHGVEFWSLNESFDTTKAWGRAMLRLVLVFAELEREQTAERTRDAALARAQRGLYGGGHPKLGYAPRGGGHLDTIDDEADLVRVIFDQYQVLRSAPKLSRWLNERGYRTKKYQSRRGHEQGGNPFKAAGLRTILTDRLYLGEVPFKGEVYQGHHQPIVRLENFDRVQEIIAGNAKNKRGAPKGALHDYPLTGVLTCGSCGCSLTTGAGSGRSRVHHYYECTGVQKEAGHDCVIRRVDAHRLEKVVLGVISEAVRDPVLLQEAADEAEKHAREKLEPKEREVARLRRDLARAEREGAAIFKAIVQQGITESRYSKIALKDAERQEADLRHGLAQAEAELLQLEQQHLDLDLLHQVLQSFDLLYEHMDSAEKREFIGTIIHRVVVHMDHVEIGLYDGTQAQHLVDLAPATGKRAKSKKGAGRKGRGRRAQRREARRPHNDETGRGPSGGSRPVRDGSRCWT